MVGFSISTMAAYPPERQGLKNVLSDYLSRTNFDGRLQMKSEDLCKEAFQQMDTQLDVSPEKHELLSVSLPRTMKKSISTC